jgi:hypothetical protein
MRQMRANALTSCYNQTPKMNKVQLFPEILRSLLRLAIVTLR